MRVSPERDRSAGPVARAGAAVVLGALAAILAGCSNTPPRLQPIDDVTGRVDEVLEFDVYGSDVDGDDLVFSVQIDGTDRPDLLSALSNNQAHFRWIPNGSEAGEHTADFYLFDGAAESTERIAITVLPREDGGNGPQFVSPDRYLLDVNSQTSIEFVIEVKEDSTTDVTLEITKALDGGRFNGQAAELGAQVQGKKAQFFWAPSPEQLQVSQHFLGVRAFDGAGGESTQTISIVLRGVDDGCRSQPPNIEHTPLGDGPAAGGIYVSARATDAESRVTDVTVFFSLVPNPGDADFRSLRLTASGEDWSGMIPDPGLAAGSIATITYYVCARDDDDPTTVGDPDAGDRCDRLACTARFSFVANGPLGGTCAPCTSTAQCPPGSSCIEEGGSLRCVPDFESCTAGGGGLCAPCEGHGDCGGVNDYCISNGETGESFCGVDCAMTFSCDPGNVCADLGDGIHQCVPEAYTCRQGGGAGLCEPCETRDDCGGAGDYCLQGLDGSLFCGQDCATSGCPAGYECYDLSDFEPGLMQCAPSSGSCRAGGGARAARPGDLLVNEALADPGVGVDVNGDGNASTAEDEFVEILNVSSETVDLTGVSVDDGAADSEVRFTFPSGTTLAPGLAVVVFGGGNETAFRPMGGSQVFTSRGLGLTNDGDSVTLRDASGLELARASWGTEGGRDESLTLSPDGSGVSFVGHGQASGGAATSSPGTQLCGNPFPVAQNPCQGGGGCGGDRDDEPNDAYALAVCLSSLPSEVEGHLDHQPGSSPPGPDAVDYWVLPDVSPGQTITVATYPGPMPDVEDTVVRLFDAFSTEVAMNDDVDAQTYYSELSHVADVSGPWVVAVEAYKSTSAPTAGSYLLRVEVR